MRVAAGESAGHWVDLAEHQQTEALNFRTLSDLLRRRWYVVLLFLAVPAATLAFSLAQEDKYAAETSILFRDIGASSVIASEDPEREAATNIQVLSLDTIKQRVEERLGGAQAAAESVEVAQEGQSNVLKVTATDPSPVVAARTANAYASEYVAFRRETESGGRATRGPAAARVLSPAQPPGSPSSPKPVRNTIIGAFVGLFLAGILALLLERLDPRLRTPKEAETALERPILGLVRRSRRLAKPRRGAVPPAAFDDFLALHSYLRYMGRDGELRSVLITSGAPGDGKTTIAWNLASAAAAPGTKVLLIEGDLRQPTLARALGVTPERGLADVLARKASIQDVVQEVAVTSSENGERPGRVVDVVFAGRDRRPTDPSGWERFGGLIGELENQYDLIVIDTPPIVSIPDAVPLLPYVGGVIVIGRLGSTPRAALVRLKEQLDTVDAPTLGAVVNAVGKNASYIGYGYGYGGRR